MFDVRPTNFGDFSGGDGAGNFGETKESASHSQNGFRSTRGVADIRSSINQPLGSDFPLRSSEYESRFAFPETEQPELTGKRRANVYQLGKIFPNDIEIPTSLDASSFISTDDKIESYFKADPEDNDVYITEDTEQAPELSRFFSDEDIAESPLMADRKKKTSFRPRKRKRRRIQQVSIFSRLRLSFSAPAFSFATTLILFSLVIPFSAFYEKGLSSKDTLSVLGRSALGEFAKAKDNLVTGQYTDASKNFEDSYQILADSGKNLAQVGGNFSDILRYIPGMSRVATAEYLVRAGEDIALAGKNIADSLTAVAQIGNPLEKDNQVPLTGIFLQLSEGIKKAQASLEDANGNLSKSNIEDLPPEIQASFVKIKTKLPQIVQGMRNFSDNSQIILDFLGYNGPRKFLFIFQNNQEMRATGGFIGSYGVLDVADGKIKKLFVDDIYNPDGQIKARIVPPEPIQKMSAAWMMHDSNWFPDFPTSAEKISWFYEKTGGPTVDGVIAMTPDVIQKMLEISGPIEMPDYGLIIDSQNFVEATQTEVELNYDKTENQPKKIIADLTPQVLDRVLSDRKPGDMLRLLSIINDSLKEKQLLIYSKNYNIQKIISNSGWSGEILDTPKDYLSVVNTNIGGYKTDAVIDETIDHHSTISEDGSIVDEVTITRKHNGGNEKYDWWNKVNADYLRVYIPENSVLLEASGQTREFVSPPLDYKSLGFSHDPQVLTEEEATKIDDTSGTRIYSENRKTVFANWVYVSPGEEVVLKYKYKLPFRLVFDNLQHPADTFSVLYQKQSGSRGSRLESRVDLPSSFSTVWAYPENSQMENGNLKTETDLTTDKIVGAAILLKK